jgi:isocitrate dehydrogenase
LKLEKSVIQTIESGFFTKDLALQVKGEKFHFFILELAEKIG